MANINADDFVISAKVVPDTSEITSEFKRISKTTTFNVNAKLDGQSFKNVTKVVETFSDGLGTAKQKTTLLNQANEELASTTTKVSTKLNQTNSSIKEVSSSSQEASTQAKKLGQSFGDIVTKVSKFYLATAPINMLQDALREAIDIVKEFDDSIVDLQKVSDLSGDSLTEYTKKLGELGETVARTRTEMVQNATIFKQAGYSDDDAATLSRVAA